MTFDQPRLTQAPKYQSQSQLGTRPTTSHSMARSSFWMGNRSSVRQSTISRPRTSTFSGLIRPLTSYSTSKHRLRISAPTDFRHVEGQFLEKKRSFRRLELSIYLPNGRLSPLPDFDDFADFSWEAQPTGLEMPQPAHVRSSIVSSDESQLQPNSQIRRKSLSVSNGLGLQLSADNGPGPTLRQEDFGMGLPGLASVDESLASSYPRDDYLITLPRRRSTSASSRPASSNNALQTSSSLTDTTRISRTPGSLRRSKTNDTVDEAIRELNTIVEERRVSALQRSHESTGSEVLPPSSPTRHHVPAIAPSMKVRARSETLSDIGSAFSMPLTSNPVPIPSSNFNTPNFAMPPLSPPAAVLKTSNSARLRTWLRRSIHSSGSDTPPSSGSSRQFYHLAPEASEPYSNRSSSSTVSSLYTLSSSGDSPGSRLTAVTTPPPFEHSVRIANEHDEAATGSDGGASPPRPSMSSMSKRTLRRVPAFPKRGVSIDTTVSHVSSSSVGTSILGLTRAPPAYQEVDPLREPDVGMAF